MGDKIRFDRSTGRLKIDGYKAHCDFCGAFTIVYQGVDNTTPEGLDNVVFVCKTCKPYGGL